MNGINQDKLMVVAGAALRRVQGQPRWARAIERAAQELADNPYVSEQDGGIVVLSPSDNIYSANGTCQCKAYEHGRPCWHRAAARLLERYREAEQAGAVFAVKETK